MFPILLAKCNYGNFLTTQQHQLLGLGATRAALLTRRNYTSLVLGSDYLDLKSRRFPAISTNCQFYRNSGYRFYSSAIDPPKNIIDAQKTTPNQPPLDPAKKPSLLKRAWDGVKHAYLGFKLFGLEFMISTRLLANTIKTGERLNRRERRQLVRTLADVLKIFPYFVFIVVPMLEFLLPLYIKFFPFMQPSTFKTSDDKVAKVKKSFNQKLEVAKVLQDSLIFMKEADSKLDTSQSEQQQQISDISKLNMTELKTYLRQFEDELTFNNLKREHVVQLCKLLNLPTVGPLSFLRFQLRLKGDILQSDDQVIAKEGTENMTTSELVDASKTRGLPAYKMNKAQLLAQLTDWITLSVHEQIPISILLFTSALYTSRDPLPIINKLSQAVKEIPDELKDEVEYSTRSKDRDIAIKVIQAEEESLKAEKSERKEFDDKHEKEDSQRNSSSDQSIESKVENEDIDVIEDALHKISKEKKNEIIEDTELKDFKTEISKFNQANKMPESNVSRKVASLVAKLDALADSIESQSGPTLQGKMLTNKADTEIDYEVSTEEVMNTISTLKNFDKNDYENLIKIVEFLDGDKNKKISLEETLDLLEQIGDEVKEIITTNQLGIVLNMLVKLKSENNLNLKNNPRTIKQ